MFPRAVHFLLLLGFGTSLAISQTPASASTMVPARALEEDVVILRSAFEQLHPGLYRYNTKAETDRAFEDLERDFSKDRTLEQVFLRLAEFTAKIRCGHTFPNPYNQSKAVTTALFEGRGKLPFFYEWIGGAMVVTRDFTAGHNLPAGTQVMSINGLDSRLLLGRLMNVASADGSNDAKRINLSQRQGNSRYENPDLFLPIIVPGWGSTLRLRIRKPSSTKIEEVEVEKETDEEAKVAFAASQPDLNGSKPLFNLRYLPNGAAVLTMPTWVMFNSKWDWKSWLNRSLDEMIERKSPALIVDLRGNAGGDDVGDLILQRLRRGTATQHVFNRLVRYRRAPQSLLPYLSTWDETFKDWGSSAVDLSSPLPTAPPVHYFRQLQEAEPPADSTSTVKHFTGQVYVLTDASNSSATFNFARSIQQEHLGLLLGGATGGNQRGINGGAFFFLKLPNSGIEVDLPLIGYFPDTEQPDAGLLPDIPVSTSQKDIQIGGDRVLSTAQGLVDRHEGSPPRP